MCIRQRGADVSGVGEWCGGVVSVMLRAREQLAALSGRCLRQLAWLRARASGFRTKHTPQRPPTSRTSRT
jgi:hypothetical protein